MPNCPWKFNATANNLNTIYWANKEKLLQIKSYSYYSLRHLYSVSCFHNCYRSYTVSQISFPLLLKVSFH